MKQTIYIYCDKGVGDFSLYSTQNYFTCYNIKLVTAKHIIKNGIPNTVHLFVMPGGADRFYAKKLNGLGNSIIKQYVEQGGTYLGICAGAYYGCSNIEFQKGTINEICQKRELSFLNGDAIGCIADIAPTYDQTLKSASITLIKIMDSKIPTLYWGGCYFNIDKDSSTHIIATYDNIKNQPPAIIYCPIGKGQAILSGVHFEVSSIALKNYNFKNTVDNKLKTQIANKLRNTNHLLLQNIKAIIEDQT